jgi:hypothetical protein
MPCVNAHPKRHFKDCSFFVQWPTYIAPALYDLAAAVQISAAIFRRCRIVSATVKRT